MKKLLVIILPVAILALIGSINQVHAVADSDAKELVRAFYDDFKGSINRDAYDDALVYARNNFAPDFMHFDDGKFSYDKEGMISILEQKKNGSIRLRTNIKITKLAYMEESDDVHVKTRMQEVLYRNTVSEENFIGSVITECDDYFRTGGEYVQMYKCECTIISQNIPDELWPEKK